MRDAAINLRALPEQRDLIDHAASLLGKNRSDFMLEAACDRAQSVVLDQVFFSLDADKFKQFTAMLDEYMVWYRDKRIKTEYGMSIMDKRIQLGLVA